LDIKNILYQKDLKEEAQNQTRAFFSRRSLQLPLRPGRALSVSKTSFFSWTKLECPKVHKRRATERTGPRAKTIRALNIFRIAHRRQSQHNIYRQVHWSRRIHLCIFFRCMYVCRKLQIAQGHKPSSRKPTKLWKTQEKYAPQSLLRANRR